MTTHYAGDFSYDDMLCIQERHLRRVKRAQYIKTLAVLHKAGQRGGKDVRKVINIIHRQNMDRVL